ncbi:MAG: YdbC family protein [Aedoeadaptatus pacaensis]|uniref:YdbC family protein n=1 Tax=Aedoeadaptatus urinae TaxID=1871017 RepID=UPI00097D3F76|nr:YdbC family protein [Peptoniphilus urinae]
MAEFKFEIVEHLGVLSTSPNGWTKELNRVSYNGAEPKFDLRSWSEDHEKMSKGITLSVDEFEALRELIK